MIRFEVLREILIANELGDDLSLVYRFSDADGVRTGKSGYSFGVSQFDIENNPSAILCLRACDFTTDEIRGLRSQTIEPIPPLDAKLKTSASVVDRWDRGQVVECLQVPISLCDARGIHWADDAAVYHLADYHNQFYMSRGGKMHSFLTALGRPFTGQDIRECKLGLPWGKKRPDDVERRYRNIVQIVGRQQP